ncbi:5-hydroxytryptamine receptor 4-like [Centruroides vittatus]|uniref:5-hydroxytryptamine receptor 4-like n=1 Tax=Centruroides vittatus TaxID=120091 RepID=UPI0035102F47
MNFRRMESQEFKEVFNGTSAYSEVISDDSANLPDDLSPSSASLLQEAIVTLLTLLLLSGILTNSIFFLVFYSQAKLRSFSNRFVLCLCTSHLLQSILVTPFTLTSVINQSWVFGEVWCQVNGMASLFVTMASVLSLLMIAIDRNYAVNSPLHYSRTVTKSRTSILILSIWTFSFLSSIPPLCGIGRIQYRPEWFTCTILWTDNDKYTALYSVYLLTFGFLIPFLTMACIYVSMYRAAKNNSARARKHSLTSSCKQAIISTPKKSSTRRRSSCGSQSSLFGEEWKAAKTGLFVVLSFILCWLPMFSVILTETFTDYGSQLPQWITSTAILLSSSACIINPYLYVYRNKSTRSQLKKMLHLCSKEKKNRSSLYAQNRRLFVPSIPSSTFKVPIETTCISPWPSFTIYGRKSEQMSCITSPIEKNPQHSLEQGILNNNLLNAMDLDVSTLKSSNRMMIFKLRCNAKNKKESIEEADPNSQSAKKNESTKMTLSRTKSMTVFGNLLPQEVISQEGGQRRKSFVMTRYRVQGSDETNSTSIESQDSIPSTNVVSDLSGKERRILYRQWNRSGSEDAGYISRRSSICSIVSSDSDNLGKILEL